MANSYLYRTLGTPTHANKGTVSHWIKRSIVGVSEGSYGTFSAFENGGSSSNRAHLNIYNDTIYFYDQASSTVLQSNRKFRDTSAWYHIVIAWDTTQGTSSNRIKIYVNGVQETSFSTETYPAQNATLQFNISGRRFGVGCLASGGNAGSFWDGYISHFAFVDGQQLAPTVFGETDSTSGIWKFKSPSGVTWGTNGVHLKFENSAALGTDSSGQSNTYTVNGNLKQALDTPSNVYNTLNPLDAFNTSGRTLSNGNNTYTTSSGNNSEVAGTLAVSSGKWYFETKIVAQSGSTGSSAKYGVIGVKKINKGTLAAGEAATIYSDGRKNNGYDSVNSATPGYTLNDIVQVALDLDNNQIFFGLNGNWGDNAGNFNQTFANATALYTSLSTVGEWTPYLNKNVTNDNTLTLSANFGNGFFGTTAITSAGSNGNGSLFEYDVPSGYYALNTKNINTYG